jgi:hypothetical protein
MHKLLSKFLKRFCNAIPVEEVEEFAKGQEDMRMALVNEYEAQLDEYKTEVAELQVSKDLRDKGYLLHDKYKIIPAFELDGETYYMHEDPLNIAAGRGLTAMRIYEELMMRCDVNYLRYYCEAVRAIFSDPKKIDILKLATITQHLEERINFLSAIPDHVYKMASVVFFTESESAFIYDQKKGAENIKRWKEVPGMYDFFMQTPLVQLIPSLALPEENSNSYLAVQEKISEIHFSTILDVLSKTASQDVLMN